MLFHSTEFLFYFLPLTWLGFVVLVKAGRYRTVLAWLTLASLVFYAWWNPSYIWLILASISANFTLSRLVRPLGHRGQRARFRILCAGLTLNLAALAYYKYANFFIDNINGLLGTGFMFDKVILPLAISFFTFQQIVFLVESYRGNIRDCKLLDYSFAVSFFPHLIAGPIVQYQELLPQIRREHWKPVRLLNLEVGSAIFLIGLFKKMVLGDGCGEYATPIFGAIARDGAIFGHVDAWVGILAYTFQIYFDFSGYSDMAIGLARCFGIVLPLNFNSPYRATSIIDFWRRWHITLSRFLRDYLYIPLGGGRGGISVRLRNLMVTMLLGGLWHGAGWTFVIWGGLHGGYLIINHSFRALGGRLPSAFFGDNLFVKAGRQLAGWALTFFAVTIAWVFFRAENLSSAYSMLQSMFLLQTQPQSDLDPKKFQFLLGYTKFGWLAIVAAIAFLAPNTQHYMSHFTPSLVEGHAKSDRYVCEPAWRPSFLNGLLMGVLLFFVVRRFLLIAPTEFLYFNF